MNTLTAILLDGTVYASWLFLVAAGLTVIYGVMRLLNMAHGSFYAVGAYAAASAIGWYFGEGHPGGYSFLLIIACALGVGLVLGLLIERGLLRFMYGRDEVVMVLVTYALLLILEDVTKLIWGADPYFAYQPYGLLGRTAVGPLTYANYDFALIGIAVLVGALLWYGLYRTNRGRITRAVIQDPEVAVAMGVNVPRVFTLTFVLGAVLGALSGALTAPAISVAPGIGVEVIVLAFAVVVTGGLGSIGGAAIGALLVGLARASAVHLAPQLELFVVYAVMSAVLCIRPQGLFGRVIARKI